MQSLFQITRRWMAGDLHYPLRKKTLTFLVQLREPFNEIIRSIIARNKANER